MTVYENFTKVKRKSSDSNTHVCFKNIHSYIRKNKRTLFQLPSIVRNNMQKSPHIVLFEFCLCELKSRFMKIMPPVGHEKETYGQKLLLTVWSVWLHRSCSQCHFTLARSTWVGLTLLQRHCLAVVPNKELINSCGWLLVFLTASSWSKQHVRPQINNEVNDTKVFEKKQWINVKVYVGIKDKYNMTQNECISDNLWSCLTCYSGQLCIFRPVEYYHYRWCLLNRCLMATKK